MHSHPLLFICLQSEHEFSAESALAALDPERWQQRRAGPLPAPHFSIREEAAPPSASASPAPLATRAQPSGAARPLRRTATPPSPAMDALAAFSEAQFALACSSRDHEEPVSERVPDRDFAERAAPSSGVELSLDALPGASPYEDEDLFNLAALAAPLAAAVPAGQSPEDSDDADAPLAGAFEAGLPPSFTFESSPVSSGAQGSSDEEGVDEAQPVGASGPSQSHGAINCALGRLFMFILWP